MIIKKKEILDDLLNIESKIPNSNNIILLDMINYIEETYSNLIKNYTYDDDKDIEEKTLFNELKNTLYNKIIILLNTNPEWFEYLNPILDDLSLTNITLDYIYDKLDIIKDLEDNENNIDYYKQFKNICLFIKSQIEEGLIVLNSDKLNELINLINSSLILIQNNNLDTYWEEEISIFNKKCELINFDNK